MVWRHMYILSHFWQTKWLPKNTKFICHIKTNKTKRSKQIKKLYDSAFENDYIWWRCDEIHLFIDLTLDETTPIIVLLMFVDYFWRCMTPCRDGSAWWWWICINSNLINPICYLFICISETVRHGTIPIFKFLSNE